MITHTAGFSRTQVKCTANTTKSPGEVIEQTENILQGIVTSRLIPATFCGSGQVIGQEAGNLTCQTRVHRVRRPAFKHRQKDSADNELDIIATQKELCTVKG